MCALKTNRRWWSFIPSKVHHHLFLSYRYWAGGRWFSLHHSVKLFTSSLVFLLHLLETAWFWVALKAWCVECTWEPRPSSSLRGLLSCTLSCPRYSWKGEQNVTTWWDNPTASSSRYHQPGLSELSSRPTEWADGVERTGKVKERDSHDLVLVRVDYIIQIWKWHHSNLCDMKTVADLGNL